MWAKLDLHSTGKCHPQMDQILDEFTQLHVNGYSYCKGYCKQVGKI